MALNERIYFYIMHTEEMLIAHPFLGSVYQDNTPEELAENIIINRQGKIDSAKRAGFDEPTIDTMTIIKEQLPGTYTGFVVYYYYFHPEEAFGVTMRPDAENIPDIAEEKTAYAAQFEPWDWVVISGIYKADEQVAFMAWVRSLSIAFFAIVAVLALLTWRITRSVNLPLENTVVLMNDISEGTGDLSKRLNIEGKNELVQFAHGFNTFAGKIANIVRQVLRTNEEVVNHSKNLMEVMTRTVSRSDEQLSETEMLASAATELSYSLSSVAERAQDSSEAASSAQGATEKSQTAMNRNINSIEQLTQALSTTQKEVENMQSFSDNVSSVLEVIVSIAEQTNLLALNAAIEAARAGEQGRGFAVVADEVRTLAQRTQNSTSEIRQIVENLQSGTKRVVVAMEQGLDSSRECVSTAGASNEELTQVISYVEQITQMNAEIASAVEQQSSTTQEIAASSNKIAANSKDILSDSEANRSALQAMDLQLKTMEELVRGFKV
ncbi:MAG: methyl-accepting chemotaxis protein [Pseudohongiellaceae bacterium]|nr:methyl-accepting chemotaxis protein [Pseudohongiellaceae bacterium]